MTVRNRRIFTACLLAIVTLAVLRLARDSVPVPVPVPVPAGGTAEAVPGIGPAASAVAAAMGAGSAAAASLARISGQPPSPPATGETHGMEIPPEGLEFCGVRRVTAEELRRWKADRALGQAQVQAIGEKMQRIGSAGVARISARLAAGNERQQVAARLLMQDREGAALLAERSSDAQAYQMALSACQGWQESVPHCARLNARRWAELDPSDARPWLRLLADAQRRKDAAGVDAALAEAAARPRLSRGSWLLETQAVAAADAVPDTADLGQALAVVIGIDAMMWPLDIRAPLSACNDDALRDRTRLAQCRSVARQVLAGATDFADANLARLMAERTGVPREQQAYQGDTLKAAQNAFHTRTLEGLGMDCAGMRSMTKLSTERTASSELAMALALLPRR